MNIVTLRKVIPPNQGRSLINKLREHNEKTSIVSYSEVPRYYESNNQWSTHSNLLCIVCNCSPRRRPFFVPISESNGRIDRGDNPITCSPNCNIRYILSNHFDEYMVYEMIRLTLKLTKLMTGITVQDIQASPNPISLKKFGGFMSDKNYQHKIYSMNPEIIAALYTDKRFFDQDYNQ